MNRLALAAACAALFVGAAIADTNTAQPFSYGPDHSDMKPASSFTTDQSIQNLNPQQKAQFDQEKSRILAKIGRSSDGKLLASNEAAPEKAGRHHRSGKAHLAKKHAKKASDTGLAKSDIKQDSKPDIQKPIENSGTLGAPLPEKSDIKTQSDLKKDKEDLEKAK